MKNFDIEILGKVVSALEKYLPETELGLLKDYLAVYGHLKAKNDKEKQYYQEKAEYYRRKTQEWREDNPEKQKEHHNNYQKRKRLDKEQKKIQSVSETDKMSCGDESAVKNMDFEYILPLTASSHLFIGEMPVAVLFGEDSVNVKSWREVYSAVLTRCNQNEEHHKMLMYLRGKAAGKCRVFLSDNPDGMTRPIKIDEGLYGEAHYGSQTLIHILINRILAPVGFDCHNISVALKTRNK